jgi:hypothetical protein
VLQFYRDSPTSTISIITTTISITTTTTTQ